jgi:23S rRNA (pseudouridine1915-N3)-methyltransferase
MSNKISILTIDNRKSYHFAEQEEHYIKQMSKWNFNVQTYRVKKQYKDQASRQTEESSLLLQKSVTSTFKIALDPTGSEMHTEELYQYLTQLMTTQKHICFLIGGADGHDKQLIKATNKTLSLSKLTFSHQLARIILIEQLFRCYTLSTGHPYHRA